MAAEDSKYVEQLSTKLELLICCLRLIGSDNSSIANKASKVFMSLTRQGDAANVLVSAPIVDEMFVVSRKNDVVRYRIYDIVIAFCCASEEKLLFCDENKLIHSLLDEVTAGDILIQLNALELLTTLVSCQHGRDYLEKQNIIQKLACSLDQSTADPLASLLVPGLMKFFGALAHFQPDIITKYSNFTNTMFNLLNDSDTSLKIIAIETLCFIATTPKGKFVLDQQGISLIKIEKEFSLYCYLLHTLRYSYRIWNQNDWIIIHSFMQ